MRIKTSENTGILYLSGTVHRETADCITEMFHVLQTPEISTIIISFDHVKALLSDGIRLMVSLADAARREGKVFFITDLSKEVKYTLKITNLLELLGYAGSSLNLLKERNISEQSLKELPLPKKCTVAAPTENRPALHAPGAVRKQPTPKPDQQQQSAAIDSLKTIGKFDASTTTTLAAPVAPVASLEAVKAKAHDPHADARKLATHRNKILTEAELKQAIKQHIPGRTELRIVDCMMKTTRNALSATDIAHSLRLDEEAVKKALARLQKLGTINAMGGGLFNYSPSEDVKNQILSVIRLLQKPDEHSKVLRLLLSCEH